MSRSGVGARPRAVGLFRIAGALALASCAGDATDSRVTTPVATPVADPREFRSMEDFLGGYWNRPIPPQGPAPAAWSSLEASLAPPECGTCHVQQYEDWQTAVHAGAYSAGLAGQLVSQEATNFGFVRSCLVCHGPLSEQQSKLPLPEGGHGTNPDFDPQLKEGGIVCAACHVRGQVRYGPPTREGATAPSAEGMPHGGVVRSDYFEDSRFCAGCHQFASPAPNGKSLQNTYEEWLDSRYATEGVGCQTCHMPDRRHLWRGIHDPDMVRAGVTIEWMEGSELEPGRVGLRVTNSGTGHRFPTYVTPAVDVTLELLDGTGSPIPGAARSAEIVRRVALQGGSWVESSDTRLAPDSSMTLTYPAPVDARFVRGEVRVRPDAFYRNVFAGLLARVLTDTARVLIEAAHEGAIASPFTIFDDTVAIGR
ncbi:MAG: multiheme c-type cytochrome [Gemmatimonadota bacterium]|nr:multiheme c-type cytochrome [Gemmatimonadota bacterium]